MTVQMILQGDIPELRQTSAQVTSFADNLIALLANLTDTLTANSGFGLSAPQIGVHQRVFVIDLGQGVQEFINPEIVETSGEVEGSESCLSFPGHTLRIIRPQWITVKAQDRAGRPLEMTASDLLARAICHEVDHLNGILFMDYLADEDIFSQLLGTAFIMGEEFEPDEEVSQSISLTGVEQEARQQDFQLASDMLADLAWKLTLSLEILKEYREIFREAIAWNKLEEITNILDETIHVVEGYAESPGG